MMTQTLPSHRYNSEDEDNDVRRGQWHPLSSYNSEDDEESSQAKGEESSQESCESDDELDDEDESGYESDDDRNREDYDIPDCAGQQECMENAIGYIRCGHNF
ncbi:hypothetical protein DdX_21292 [Ditylenchus destructor]|uniref:Uncharacterized protein n=1 Tax=Ditylenchus destructor TaxID=166010 RepID=A0AAD4QRG0_9BILA|nr:hypothetical protein DdX_21292 [Ditylenchus destructor]